MAANTSTFRTYLGYGLYVLIAGGCGLLAWHIGPTALGVVVATPGAASLAAIPWQLFRDQRAHERAIELADHNSAIALGVDSPMARATFEKYVEFAREYADAVADAVSEIVQAGPNRTHLQLSQKLSAIRRKHVLWVPKKTDETLFQIEDAIWRMAVDAGFTHSTAAGTEDWQSRYEAAHRRWCEILGVRYQPIYPMHSGTTDADVETNLQQMVLHHLREVLGTEDYSRIRELAISRALKAGDIA